MGKDYCVSCGLQKTVWVKLNDEHLCASCASARGRNRTDLYVDCKYNSKLTVSGNSLIINNRGKEIVVPIQNIQEFQLEPPKNYASGIIRIKTAKAAGASLNVGLGISVHDSTISLFPTENAEFAEAKKIRDYISNYSNTTPPIITSNNSTADEIRKFRDLLTEGIITQEEFEQKKKQLLGL
ncbi:MAG: SHOCT domain-containing protein [Oscillospiraceae bacterium]|nr:SHOCT domain-containing protein [Oscillospiraceae bacterium]